MCRSPAEKIGIIHLVEHSDLPIKRILEELDVPRSTFYGWYQKYQEDGCDGLANHKSYPSQFWNHLPDTIRDQVFDSRIGVDWTGHLPPAPGRCFTDLVYLTEIC
jgi:hypothetical protein